MAMSVWGVQLVSRQLLMRILTSLFRRRWTFLTIFSRLWKKISFEWRLETVFFHFVRISAKIRKNHDLTKIIEKTKDHCECETCWIFIVFFFFRWKLFIVFPRMKVSKEIIETFSLFLILSFIIQVQKRSKYEWLFRVPKLQKKKC
jgi:hypothetical protein